MGSTSQDSNLLWDQLGAVYKNFVSWATTTDASPPHVANAPDGESCVLIHSPGGSETLKCVPLSSNQATVGYNVPGFKPPIAKLPQDLSTLPDDLVLIANEYFSVNFADICARWGLYDPALQLIGWPIVVGFDFAGTVQWAGAKSGFSAGDKVFGFTMFGSYSSRILVPSQQVRKAPVLDSTGKPLELAAATAVLTVAATALHAITLAGGWPEKMKTKNQAVLVHSAAGGVGGMLLQMLKLLGYHPIIAVVGRSHKVQFCKDMGADVVVDKSSCADIWAEARAHCPEGFVAIFDANGVETLASSYKHLSRCGRLITYGFHSNLPKGKTLLSPLEFFRMVYRMMRMPKFDAMSMVDDSKAVLGFELSFFAGEQDILQRYFDQIVSWVKQGHIKTPPLVVYDLANVGQAHMDIQSGTTTGKLVINIPRKHASSSE